MDTSGAKGNILMLSIGLPLVHGVPTDPRERLANQPGTEDCKWLNVEPLQRLFQEITQG